MKEPNNECIYFLINKKTKKIYVGRSVSPDVRIKEHMSAAKAERHSSKALKKDFEVYGEQSFWIKPLWYRFRLTRQNVEGGWMIVLGTYLEKYGYNEKDPYVLSRHGFPTKNVTNYESKRTIKDIFARFLLRAAITMNLSTRVIIFILKLVNYHDLYEGLEKMKI